MAPHASNPAAAHTIVMLAETVVNSEAIAYRELSGAPES
jgi:hypothetical protein